MTSDSEGGRCRHEVGCRNKRLKGVHLGRRTLGWRRKADGFRSKDSGAGKLGYCTRALRLKEPAWDEKRCSCSPGSTQHAGHQRRFLSHRTHHAGPRSYAWPLPSAVPSGLWIPPTGSQQAIAAAAARRHRSSPSLGGSKVPDANGAYISRPWVMLYV